MGTAAVSAGVSRISSRRRLGKLLRALAVVTLSSWAAQCTGQQLPCHPYLDAAVQFTCPYCQAALRQALSATKIEDCPPAGTPLGSCFKDNISEFFALLRQETCWTDVFGDGGVPCLPQLSDVLGFRLWAVSEVDTHVHPNVSRKEQECLPWQPFPDLTGSETSPTLRPSGDVQNNSVTSSSAPPPRHLARLSLATVAILAAYLAGAC